MLWFTGDFMLSSFNGHTQLVKLGHCISQSAYLLVFFTGDLLQEISNSLPLRQVES